MKKKVINKTQMDKLMTSKKRLKAVSFHPKSQVLTDRHLDILKVLEVQMMKMTDAETDANKF